MIIPVELNESMSHPAMLVHTEPNGPSFHLFQFARLFHSLEYTAAMDGTQLPTICVALAIVEMPN
jgi:hypothetical protein